jgi:PAS domain S-box-containing protein
MIGAINMLVDITEMKQIEQALRDSEQKYRGLAASLEKQVEEQTNNLRLRSEQLKTSEERYHMMVDQVEDYAIILLDANGIVQNWNKGAQKIKGYTEEEIVGKSFHTFYLEEDLRNGLPIQLLQQAKNEGKAIHEGWRKRKDGSLFWGSIVLTALHDEQGNTIGFAKVTRDLTERKRIEDKMKEYTAQLEFQNRELEQFAYAASHDLKEPLRKIQFYGSYIADNAPFSLDPRSKEYMDRLLNAARRMTRLIDDLLFYSKSTGTDDILEDIDIQGLVNDFILLRKDEIDENQVTVISEALPPVKGVLVQIKQLVDNMLSNAIKYRHPQRKCIVRITHNYVPGSSLAQFNSKPGARYYHLSIEDNGIGFHQEHAEKIFELFQRLHGRTGPNGSGIGLALCQKIVNNHKGFIKASGQPDNGAKFDIYLPA